MEQVYSVTIKGKNDNVVMTEEQCLMVKLKYSPNIEIHNLTERHGILPHHLHKLERHESAHLMYTNQPLLVIRSSNSAAIADVNWEFEDLMKGV